MLPSRLFTDDFWNEFDKPVKLEKMMKCDIYEKDNNYVIEMDMPGAKKEDLSLDLEKGYLTISYSTSKNEENSDEERKYIRRERHEYTNCSREFYVGDVEEENINASFKDGILTITVPKKEKEITKKVINID